MLTLLLMVLGICVGADLYIRIRYLSRLFQADNASLLPKSFRY